MSRCKLFLLAVLAWVVLATPSFAASSNVNSLTASPAIVGTQLFYCPVGASTDYKCTAAQIAAYTYSLMSGSCTATSGGVITCSGSGVTSFSYTCPTTGPLTGAVTLPLGIGEISESSAFAPTPAQCGSWFDVTGTTTATLPIIGAGGGDVLSPYFITIKNADTSGHVVTISGGGANINYNGSSTGTITLNQGQSVGLVVNAANTAWQATGTVTGTAPILHPGYISTDWYSANLPGNIGAAPTAPQTASTVYCALQQFPISVTIKSLGSFFAAGDSGGHVSWAIFTASGGRPATLVDYVAPIATPTTGIAVSGSLNNTTDTIAPGAYFFCGTQDNATSSMYGLSQVSTSGAVGSGATWIGETTIAPVIAASTQATGITCTAASTCGAGYAAWSAGAFTWATFASPTWAIITSTVEIPTIVFQAN